MKENEKLKEKIEAKVDEVNEEVDEGYEVSNDDDEQRLYYSGKYELLEVLMGEFARLVDHITETMHDPTIYQQQLIPLFLIYLIHFTSN